MLHDIAQLEQLRSRPVLRTPHSMLTSRAQDIWMLATRGRDVVDRRLQGEERRTRELRASLRALSPEATLARDLAVDIARIAATDMVTKAFQAGDAVQQQFAATSDRQVVGSSTT